MKKIILIISALMIFPLLSSAQVGIIQSFDTQLDSTYWTFDRSFSSDSSLAFINNSVETTELVQGTGAIKMDYSIHDAESYGGYSRYLHVLPGSEVYNWSAYDSISLWYYNSVKQSLPGRVTFRFNIFDVSDVPDSTSKIGEMEFYYSFQPILDIEPGWNEIKIALAGGGNQGSDRFTRTGWSGIAGNNELDKNKIKGFTFEFSISGTGSDDVSAGTIIFDNLSLKGSRNELKINIGFEEGDQDQNGLPDGWSAAQSAWDGWGSLSHINVQTPGANSGDYWCELGVDAGNGYAVVWQSVAAQPTTEWELSSFIKDVSPADPAGSFAALKMEAWGSGTKITEWSDYQDGVTAEWGHFSTTHIMPPGTDTLKAVLVASKWLNDGIASNYGFDDVILLSHGVADTSASEAPKNVVGIPDPTSYFNLVIWDLVPGESGETYTVYVSEKPITDLKAAGVEILGTTTDDENAFLHRLTYPMVDHEVTYYYAVTCTDNAGNVSLPGFSASTVNTAKASPAISLNPPANFIADGDLDEWFNSDILPFVFKKSLGSHIAVGSESSFDNDDDMTVTGYLAIDDNYLYMAFDILDDVYSFDPAGNFWEDDMLEVYIGLYNMTEKHKAYTRGVEPDYKIVLLSDKMFSDQVGGMDNPMMLKDNSNYEFINYGSDWAVEVKLSLDSLVSKGNAIGDKRFIPQRGMKIPLDLVFHDSDITNVRDGSFSFSPFNNDNSHESPSNWYYTWIGDTNKVVSAIENNSGVGIVREFELKQNYPNPFNPISTIEYTVPKSGKVSLTIYNVTGQKIRTLVNSKQNANHYKVMFDGSGFASGVYFYKLEVEGHVQVRKMLLVK